MRSQSHGSQVTGVLGAELTVVEEHLHSAINDILILFEIKD